MIKKSFVMILLAILVLSAFLTGCTPKTEEAPAVEEAEAPAAEEAEAPTEEAVVEEATAVEEEEAPAEEEAVTEEAGLDLSGVTVTFWHVYGEGAPMEKMNELIAKFNETNEWNITVEGLDQGNYSDVQDKVNAAVQSGDLPDIVMAYTNILTDWYSVGAIADISTYIDDPEIGLTADEKAALYPSAFAAGTANDGAQIAYPMTQSANVLAYNFTWAEELGFDSAPATSAEMKDQLCAAAAANAEKGGDFAGTGGMVYYPSSTNFLHWMYAFGGNELNDAGDAYDFTEDAVVEAAMYLNELKAEGCIFETESYPNPEQAQRKALVTMSSNAGQPYYEAAFEDAGNTTDVWGFIAAPGPDGTLAVDAFQQMLGVMASTEEREMASWLFVKWLTAPEQQADWIKTSGYLPTQTTTVPLLAEYAANDAVWATAMELAAIGPAEPQTFPAWTSVRNAVGASAAELYNAETEEEVRAILQSLNETAAELVAEIE